VLLARMKVRLFLKEFEGAEKDGRLVATSLPSIAIPWYWLGVLHSGRAAEEAARGADARPLYRRAVETIGEALRRDPRDVSILNNRALAYWGLGEAQAGRGEDPRDSFRAAIADAEVAARKVPHFAEAFNTIALAWIGMAEAEEARRIDPRPSLRAAEAGYTEALRLRPDLKPVYGNRARCRFNLAELEEAMGGDPLPALRGSVEDYDHVETLEPAGFPLLLTRGMARIRLGEARAQAGEDPSPELDRAAADLERARKLEPGSWKCSAALGRVLEVRGRYAEAALEFEKAQAAAGSEAPFLKDWIARARAMASQPPWAAELRKASHLVRRGRYAEAREPYEKGLDAAEKDGIPGDEGVRGFVAGARYNLACVYSKAAGTAPEGAAREAESARAVESLRKAFELGWSDLEAIRRDPDFEPLRGHPAFLALLAEWEKKLPSGGAQAPGK
ncbi:MAG: hypothetical protein MUC63_07030, partial [Planctomycetes bacterium]|nr:hypothetical protein [Planctomycetota bacterium]